MSEAVLEYKNLRTIKTILMDSYQQAGWWITSVLSF
jgi:hypothetical protein